MKRQGLWAAALVVAGSLLGASPQETREQRDARMKWWREAKFGMFIHWGVYAVPAGTWNGKRIGGIGEWIMHSGKIPVADYRAFAKQFNPVKYDPAAWARLAKKAGMRYMVITSKHHDGFALFPSAASEWDVADATPYGKDLIGPLAEAARKEGLRFGLYYSQDQDWNHPGGSKMGMKDGAGWDDAQKGSFDEYLQKVAVPQVREIMERYKPDVLWWDTPCLMTQARGKPLHDLMSLKPDIITNNRLGGGFAGDTETPEQHIPATGYKDRDWETCMTMNDTWGFKSYDQNWKSVQTLLRNLIDIVSKGGNYLLNVGPTAEGEIPPPSIERLEAVGKWMDANGEAVYGTSASPFKKQLAWGRCTRKEGKLYLHVFSWPQDGNLQVPLRNKAKKARLLAGGTELQTSNAGEVLTVKLPAEAPDPIASVVALEIEGEPDVVVPPPTAVAPDKNGVLTLKADEAELKGETFKLEEQGGPPNIGYWTDASDTAAWRVKAGAEGEYEVELTYALAADCAGNEFEIACGGAKLAGKLEGTSGWGDFRKIRIGKIRLPAGAATLEVKGTKQPKGGVMNLRALTLRPAKE